MTCFGVSKDAGGATTMLAGPELAEGAEDRPVERENTTSRCNLVATLLFSTLMVTLGAVVVATLGKVGIMNPKLAFYVATAATGLAALVTLVAVGRHFSAKSDPSVADDEVDASDVDDDSVAGSDAGGAGDPQKLGPFDVDD